VDAAFWGEFLLSVLVGTIAGGITNAVAVWMLFHPYERRWGIHGAIPKNKARLARSIGRTVGEKLLTPGDVVAELERSGLRDAVHTRLTDLVRQALEQERGSLRELLPAPVLDELERTIGSLGEGIAEQYVRFVRTEEFEQRVWRFVGNARKQVSDIPLANILTPERRTRIAQQAAALSTDLIEAARYEEQQSARAKIGNFLLKLAGTERTERFVERAVGEALDRTESRTVGDIIGVLSDETYVEWILKASRSPRATEFVFSTAGSSARLLLDKPIGKPARWLPADAPDRLARYVGPALWDWTVAQLPGLLQKLDIEGMVERKVLGFSTARIEEVIRGVTERELTLIVRLGYVLGAVIGATTFVLRRLIG
jgi:uncharacterized membrane protein YheB (UPF0754 family)